MIVARVAVPPESEIYASCQSLLIEVSSVLGRYQKLSVPPLGGTVTTCMIELSPNCWFPEGLPKKAENDPLWPELLVTVGGASPFRTNQGLKVPVSKPA